MARTSPTCPRCKVPAIWDRGWDDDMAPVRRCRCCGTEVPIRKHRLSAEKQARNERHEALLQKLLNE